MCIDVHGSKARTKVILWHYNYRQLSVNWKVHVPNVAQRHLLHFNPTNELSQKIYDDDTKDNFEIRTKIESNWNYGIFLFQSHKLLLLEIHYDHSL